LLNTALDLARQMATQPTRGFAFTKQALAASAANTLDAQLELEKELMRAAGKTHDYQEGVKAFLEKRTPQYKGE
jgi:2-(1,2-epoxy-1,2-dihydrophenyl)acetyl-CoA isomerase